MDITKQLTESMQKSLAEMGAEDIKVQLTHPEQTVHGDYTTNAALIAAKKMGKKPQEVAGELVEELKAASIEFVSDIQVAGPGFINFFLDPTYYLKQLGKQDPQPVDSLKDKKIMVEYAHPNTHKEMHIGHMRTLITGEAIVRLLESAGAKLFRANYQGDIGPHVAKAIWGIQELFKRENLSFDEVSGWSNKDKAHFLGRGYAVGSQEYEANKEAIDTVNSGLYAKTGENWDLYQKTRRWSLDYYDEFYTRFYTKYDRLFFESEMVERGKKIVEEHIGKVFRKENGAVIFPGEEYGLHTRVFITQAGNPTYEGKEMGNGFAEYEAFPFDLKMHIVANEQAGYFQVVFKALELIDPEKFKDKQQHVSMGMVTLTDRKMSSRTGDVLTVDWLIDQVKERVEEMMSSGRIAAEDKERVVEEIVIGAIKYSVLKVGTGQNVAFSIEKSVSLDGDSGPYLQYTYARTQSVLAKVDGVKAKEFDNYQFAPEELGVLRLVARFDEVVADAAATYSPNTLCTYLFALAQEYNLFYQKHKIIGVEQEQFRLALTEAAGTTLKQGLNLLGIKAPEKM